MTSEDQICYRCAAHATWAYSHREMAAHIDAYHGSVPAKWEVWQHCSACDTWMDAANPQHAPGCESRRVSSASPWRAVALFALIAAVLLLIRMLGGGQ